jgi:phosphoribosylformimino-5-aminoimidazole carboxamide ribotide isomerase
MLIIPAIDLKDGRCVRLLQGDMRAETVYAEEPTEAALRWAAAGARMLHVVDLDGAVSGKPGNRRAIARIIEAVRVPVQIGGGVRSAETVQDYLEMGAVRVIVGTAAIKDPAFVQAVCRDHPGRVAAGIDARRGRVAVEGWLEATDMPAVELAQRLEDSGVAAIVFTDILRDGMQGGPNIAETRRLAEAVGIPVIASGGVGGLAHIRELLPLEPVGVVGVITGKALYSGALDFAAAQALADSGPSRSRSSPYNKT